MMRVSSVAERSAHNAQVSGSIPGPATSLQACSSVEEPSADNRVLGRSIRPRPTIKVRVCDIKIIVAEHFGLLPSALDLKHHKDRFHWRPRMLALTLAWVLTDFSSIRIGKAFNYAAPRSTWDSIKSGMKRLRTDPTMGMLFSMLLLQIKEHAASRNKAVKEWEQQRGTHPYRSN